LQHSPYRRHQLRNLVACISSTKGYTCYGFEVPTEEFFSHLGFKGERLESWGSCYALGMGYRLYSTVLMRFNSPDSYSPFAVGGLNVYAYCAGDPVNLVDQNGHWPTRSPSSSLSRSPPASRRGTPPPRPRNPVARQLGGSRSRDSSLSSNTSSLSDAGLSGDSLPNSRHSSVGHRSSSITSDDQSYYSELDHSLSDSDQDVRYLPRSASPALEHPNQEGPALAPRSRFDLWQQSIQARTLAQKAKRVRSSSPSR
jgi:RHS repeat-associated protein